MKQRAKDAAKRGGKQAKRSFVYFITSDKTLQGLTTGGVFAVINKFNTNVALAIQTATADSVGVTVPIPTITLVLAVATVSFAFWADNNTDRWREVVEDATGEEAADDGSGE